MKPFIATLLAVWFLAVFFLGANGAFVTPPDKPPLPILIGVLAPLAVFIVAYMGSSEFRAFILSVDPVLLSSIQAWRFAGLGFLSLAAHGVLPGLFAWPAGLGDIAIGVTAPWIVLALARRPAFMTHPIFKVWNLLGILDLVDAVSMGALNSGVIPGVVGHVTTAPMAQLPLVLIPGFLVPFFIMLHLSALFQARRHSSATSVRAQHDFCPEITPPRNNDRQGKSLEGIGVDREAPTVHG